MKYLVKYYSMTMFLCAVLGLSTFSTGFTFECSGKRYCREMDNCAEAVFHIKRCSASQLDADNDGIPCEISCGNTKEIFDSRLKAQTGGLGLSVFEMGKGQGVGVGLSQAVSGFQCVGKQACKEMRSCEEAKFYFQECGLTRLDPDRNNIPCSGLCPR